MGEGYSNGLKRCSYKMTELVDIIDTAHNMRIAGFTVKEVAKAIGVSVGDLNHLTRGRIPSERMSLQMIGKRQFAGED